jgi:hypothetical protein
VNETSGACFDVLVITENVSRTIGNVTQPEVYVLSYLACLIALYDGRSPEWWEYSFTATAVGAPYANALRDACELLILGGQLSEAGELLTLTPRGHSELDLLRSFPRYSQRLEYLSTASSCSLTLPLPSLSDSLTNEPQLRLALKRMERRPLLDEAGMALLTPHLDGLRQAVSSTRVSSEKQDLLIPALVWLTYLNRGPERAASYG